MCELYSILRLYINFFQPTLKLIDKVRIGSKTIKKYDKAKTPYQRVIASHHVTDKTKARLTDQYKELDPILLKKKLINLQEKLWQYAWKDEIKTVSELTSLEEEQAPLPKGPRLYRKTKKPSRPHDWKTRSHPLDNVMEFIELEVKLNPEVVAKTVLKKLMEKRPSEFCKSHLRTLQRRLNEFRTQEIQREQKYQELMIDKKNLTTEML